MSKRWLPWVLLVMAGCPDDGGGGSAVGPVPEAEAPQTAVDVVCGSFEGCDCDPANMAPDGCELSIDEQVRQAQGDATAAGLGYDAACMGHFLSGIRELGCRTLGDFTLDELVAFVREYDCKVFYGTDEPGQACEALNDMGDSCVVGSVCVDSLCVAITDPAAEGESCNGQLDFLYGCQTGTFCIDVDGDQQPTCVKIPQSGDSCLGALQICDAGLACMDGTCLVAPGEGEACHTAGGSPCAEGLECNFETLVCQLLPEGGEACTFSCAEGFECTNDRCVALEPMVCDITLYDDQP